MEKLKENNEEVVDISRSSLFLKKAASDATDQVCGYDDDDDDEAGDEDDDDDDEADDEAEAEVAASSSSSSSFAFAVAVADDDVNAVLDAKGLVPLKKLCFENLDGQRGGSKATTTEICVSSNVEGENLKENSNESNERSHETSNSVGNIDAVGGRNWDLQYFDPRLSSELAVNKDTMVAVTIVHDLKFEGLKRLILTLTSVKRVIVLVEPFWVLKHGLGTINSCFGRKRIQPSETKTMEKTGLEVEVIKDDLYATPYSGDHVMLRQKSNKDSHPDETLYLSGATWVNFLELLPIIKSVLRIYENMLIEDEPYLDHYIEIPYSDSFYYID